MKTYRALTILRYKGNIIKPGIARMELSPDAEAKLIAGGCVATIASPPLAILPGWERRAARLAKHDIEDGLQLMEADAEGLAKLLRIKPATVEAWQEEIETWLVPRQEATNG